MKISYINHGCHWTSSIEPILETLKERGHEVIEFAQDNVPDILFLTSTQEIPKIDKKTKIFFVPHGIGDEKWNVVMNSYANIFLAGKRPWTPPDTAKNWKIVGWAKADALFNPKKESKDYVANLINNLPYNQSVMCIPYPNDIGPKLHFYLEYFKQRKINVIASYPSYYQEATSYYRHYNHIVIPKILNLYYFLPYIRVLICSGFTSVGREFYITKIPTIHLGQGFQESINLSNPKKTFDAIFSQVWDCPQAFLQPASIAKQFIQINDGKVVERIIKEVEE